MLRKAKLSVFNDQFSMINETALRFDLESDAVYGIVEPASRLTLPVEQHR